MLVLLAWLTSTNRRGVSWRTSAAAAATLAVMGIVVFWWPFFRVVLVALNSAVSTLLTASGAGSRFLFGPLSAGPGQEGTLGFILAFQVFPAVVFFSVVISLLYHFGVLPFVVRTIARWVRRGFGLSGAEALATSSNLFFGVESTLTVRPFLERMTRSELMMLLTSGLSTIASSVLAVYAGLLEPIFPYIAGHLISASVLSIPAAVLMAKIIVPEGEDPQTRGSVPPLEDVGGSRHWMGSIIPGRQRRRPPVGGRRRPADRNPGIGRAAGPDSGGDGGLDLGFGAPRGVPSHAPNASGLGRLSPRPLSGIDSR